MAKLRFGSGLEIKAELPLDSKAVIGPAVVEKSEPKIDVEEILQKVMSLLPKDEPKVEVQIEKTDLTPVHADILALDLKLKDLQDAMYKTDEELLLNVKEVQKFKKQMLDIESLLLATPQVKQITHVKDVSKDVMEHVEANKQELKGDLRNHANHLVELQSQIKSQKVINLVLGASLLLTIFLHLL